jgi:ribosomal protein S18 acetylase RimI-like enzyme
MQTLATPCLDSTRPRIWPAREGDSERLFDALTLAFAADPAVRWLFPDPLQYLCDFPRFALAFGSAAIACGTAHVCETYAGAALWLPPGAASDDEALVALLDASLADERKATAFEVFDRMALYHPQEPHWYLPLIGVEPTRQRRGYGSALVAHALRLCDDLRLPAYLESSSPRNVALYRRHGFEVMDEIRIGDCPPIVPMLRPARARNN